MVPIPVSGYGVLVIIFIYITGFFAVALTSSPDASRVVQLVLIAFTVFLLTIINYFVARLLNQKAVQHTVADIRLEKFVIYCGIFGILLALFMLTGEFK